MNKMMNLQDVFLNQARKEKILVTIILMNGFQFKGIVKGFDRDRKSTRLKLQSH